MGSDVLIALKRSHLLAKVARDDERNASGRAPDIFVFWSGEAWAGAAARRRLRGRRAWSSQCCWRAGTWPPRPRKSRTAWCLTAILSLRTASECCGMAPGGAAAWADTRASPSRRRPRNPRWRSRRSRSPTAASKEFTVLADPGDARASRMAKDFATVMSASGTPGRAIVGSTSPNGLGKVLKGDMADFAIVSLDSLLSSAKGDSEWIKRAPFVARLAPETLAVIAPREVKSINDLQGKTVSFGDLDSATSTSGRMLFSRLGVTATQTNEPLPEALDRLAAGKVDAVVVLGAEEFAALSDFGGDGRFHIVTIPWSPALEPVYAPAHVTAADRPNLVSATIPVETVGEPMALVALDAAPGSPRADGARPGCAGLL